MALSDRDHGHDQPADQKRVEILLPSPMQGSGGHRTAVAAGEALAAAGFEVHAHFQPSGQDSEEEVQQRARAWHGADGVAVHMGWPEVFPVADAVIATTWQSAAFLGRAALDGLRMHFVQDYEAWFHPMGDEYVAAAGVHDLGPASIVIGDWLRRKLMVGHGLGSWSVPFTADAAIYRPDRRPAPGAVATVVAMYQPDKPRRCGALMRAALVEVLASDPGVEVVTVGSAQSPELGPRHRHLGVVKREALADLYSAGTVGFSISASNPSRVPFEMLACGLPVVEFAGENTVFDLPQEACVLAHPDPTSMSRALLELLADEPVRSQMSEAGIRFMKHRPSQEEASSFVDAVTAALSGQPPPDEIPAPRYSRSYATTMPRPAWGGSAADPRYRGSEAEQQLRVNEELSAANHELNRANHDLNAANQELHRINSALRAEAGILAKLRARYTRTAQSKRGTGSPP
jgi:hypothetical protein